MRLSRNEIEAALGDEMFSPQPLSSEQLRLLSEAAQKKGSALSDEERSAVLGLKPVTTRRGDAAGFQYEGDPRCR